MRLHRVIRHELEEKGPLGAVSGKLNVTVDVNVTEKGGSGPPADDADKTASEECADRERRREVP